MTGLRPNRVKIYREALRHSSAIDRGSKIESNHMDNERLEFLGDAILDAAIADFLFKKYPYKQEGFLTEMRMRIVNRTQLGYLADRLGLQQLMQINPETKRNPRAMSSITGNALEALIGAIYLDKGYLTTRKFIVERLLGQYMDLEKLMNTTISYKAELLKWAQQNRRTIKWDSKVDENQNPKLYTVTLFVDEAEWACEKNYSRKGAEELCCEKGMRKVAEEIGNR